MPTPDRSESSTAVSRPVAAAPKARVFFALWPSPALAGSLAARAEREAAALGGRASRADTLHLTLAFLGDVAVDRLPALIAAARGVTGPPFTLTLDQLGFWPHNRIRWAGCSRPPPALGELALSLRRGLEAAGFMGNGTVEVAVDDRKTAFFPHVTLVRKAQRPTPTVTLDPAGVWSCREFLLVRSRRDARGASYACLQRFPLGGSAG